MAAVGLRQPLKVSDAGTAVGCPGSGHWAAFIRAQSRLTGVVLVFVDLAAGEAFVEDLPRALLSAYGPVRPSTASCCGTG